MKFTVKAKDENGYEITIEGDDPVANMLDTVAMVDDICFELKKRGFKAVYSGRSGGNGKGGASKEPAIYFLADKVRIVTKYISDKEERSAYFKQLGDAITEAIGFKLGFDFVGVDDTKALGLDIGFHIALSPIIEHAMLLSKHPFFKDDFKLDDSVKNALNGGSNASPEPESDDIPF